MVTASDSIAAGGCFSHGEGGSPAMRTVTVRLTAGNYAQIKAKADLSGQSLNEFFVKRALDWPEAGGGAGESIPLVYVQRLEAVEERLGHMERRVGEAEERQVEDRRDIMVLDRALPPSISQPGQRPDPLAGLLPPVQPPVQEFRVAPRPPLRNSRGKKAREKEAICKRCLDGCVPEICVCGCHRKERGL